MTELDLYLENEQATLSFGNRLARATFIDQESVVEPDTGSGVPIVGGVIHLLGDLGAGKTTLTRGILRAFGYSGAVKSPTYTLVEPYEFEQCHIYHFDLYRLSDPEEVDYLGTEDYFAEGNLCIIEWADRGGSSIPAPDLQVRIDVQGTGRHLHCQSFSEKGELIGKRLSA